MTTTIKLTAAQAMMRWLSVQMTEDGERFIEGVWAIFGHGNVAGIGEALHGSATRCRPGVARTSKPWPMPRSPMPRPSVAAVRMR